MSEQSEESIIRLKGVSKRYGFGDSEYFALRDFDLKVRRGEFIMVMGPSGCGKTTLLNIVGLLDKATEGEYVLGGKNVERISARRQAKFRSRQIGFIFQNFNLIPTLPVIENVSLPLVYAGFGKTRRLRMASNILDHFHLQEREYYMPWQLSGGQQQRVAIARSLVAGPSIILADEPTGNLDSRSSHIVMEELRDIHSLGNTIIMVTHNPALTTYATRVINMLDGEIDTDIKTVADQDLPKPGDPEKISVRILSKMRPPVVQVVSEEPVKVVAELAEQKTVEQARGEASADPAKEKAIDQAPSKAPVQPPKEKVTEQAHREAPVQPSKKAPKEPPAPEKKPRKKIEVNKASAEPPKAATPPTGRKSASKAAPARKKSPTSSSRAKSKGKKIGVK